MGKAEISNTYQEELDAKINRIIDITERIEPNKLTILTGSNGSGKSLVRKQLCFKLADKIDGTNYKRLVVDVSMQRRTESNVYLGAMANVMHDDPWKPTSISTYHFIQTLFNSFLKDDGDKRYIVIDEPEIGMSKESQLGFVKYFESKLPEILEKTHGIMIITHSECLVSALKDKAVFLNMDADISADEWINREIIPTDLENLGEKSHELFLAIEDRMKENRK